MTTVALRGLAGRKLRSTLIALAIVLGVAMVSGTYVLTDTIDKAFNSIFQESYANTDAVISGKSADISFQGDTAAAPPVQQELLQRVKLVDGVKAAAGIISDDSNTKILTPQGKAVDTGGAPSFGFGVDFTQPQFNPLKLTSGHWPTQPGQVVIDSNTAERENYKVGDSIKIATIKPTQSFDLVGLAQYGDVASLGSATFAVFTIPEAQKLLDLEGKYSAISIQAEPGTTPQQLVKNLNSSLGSGLTIRTGTQQADKDSEQADFTKFIRYFLLAFAGIALFVGAFVIFNTFSITVAQRTREFATLRTIGASRRQVLTAVVIEALVIGILASLLGLFIGLGLAYGLQALFRATNSDLPSQGTVFALRTVIVSMLIGTIVTLLAGLFPALRATRVPPIAAVREGAELPKSRFARFTPYVAALTTALAALLLGTSLFKDDMGTAQRLLSIALGVLLLFLSVALVSSKLVRPLSAIVGWPAARIGGAAGRLAKGNSTRNPGRTASTAAALMIGVALVTFVAVLANGMKQSNRGAIEDQVKADYVVTAQDGFSPFVASAGEALANTSEAALVTPVRSDLAKVAGSSQYLTGIDPETITDAYNFEWKDGSNAVLNQLGDNGAIVSDDFAKDKDLSIGDTMSLLTPDGKRSTLQVKGIYKPPPFFPILGSVSVSKTAFDSLYTRPENSFVFVNVDGGPTAATTKALEDSVADFPDAKVQTRDAWIDQQDEDFNSFLIFLYILLALSVIVSIFGMINTLVLSVYERTRELGMLRAVGMTRRQTRRMVRHESVITALIGAALGLPLGILLAALVTKALSQFEVRFSVPVGQLVAFAIVAIVVGILAAILPAWRASRLNVLRALQYE
ncbi:MAG TPA: FtsX-like permease family protein [Gaiellaceae bacterium]